MNIEYFIATKIAIKGRRTFSKLIVRIAIIGIVLSLSIMLLSLAIIKGFKTEIKEKIRGFSGDVRVFKFDLNNSFESTPFELKDAFLQALNHHPSIEYYQFYATKPAIIAVNQEVEGVNFKGIDKQYHWDFIKSHLVAGHVINFADSVKAMQQILISKVLANRLKLKLGDSFVMNFVQNPPKKRKFTVVGIFDVGIDEVDNGFVIGNLAVIKRVNAWQNNQIGGLEIRIKDFSELNAVALSIYQHLPFNLRSESVQEFYSSIFSWLDLLDVNTQVLIILMLIVGIINMITALLIMILERTTMIGTLKAFGMTNFSIMKIFLYNAMYLVGIGLFFGNLLGLGLIYAQQYTHFLKLDSGSYYLSYVPTEIHLLDVLMLNGVTLLTCFTALILPSFWVSRISPLKAIQFK